MDFEVMKAYLPRFWDALLLTLRIGWQGVALALALGVACAVAVHWKIPVLRQIVGGYIELFRNTPLLVQLFFLYFALPKIGVRISAETCGKLGLGLLGGAYMAETFRSGLENIPIIQTESAQSLGLRPAQVFGYIILPQAVTSSVPGLLANLIFLLKETSVFSTISLISVAISIVLGIAMGMLMTSKSRLLKAIFRVYLEIVRIMPQMVLLFVVYFGTTRVFGWNLEAEAAAIIVFSFWGTAEMGDLVRGALQSIPVIHWESAQALGMKPIQVYTLVILPQTVRRLIPLSINLITRMVKTTSLVMMIGIVEVLKVAQQIIEANRRTSPNAAFGVFAVVFLLYFLICWPISRLAGYLEKRWS